MSHDSSSQKPPVLPQMAAPAAASRTRRTTSEELLGESGELLIEHEGREYRLRLTQNRKLILTA